MTGEPSKSESLYLRSLSLREKALGSEHLDVATSLFLLAEYYRHMGKYSKAEPLYERAVNIQGKLLGPKNADYKTTLERYGCLYYEQEKTDEVTALNKRMGALFKPDFGIAPGYSIVNGKAVSLPRPAYPQDARAARLFGVVVIGVDIDESGRVYKVADRCGGYPTLTKAAEEAARKARFTPTLVDGKPVKVTGLITYRFVKR
jgi:TonB family protein